jgi:hypothetical protein
MKTKTVVSTKQQSVALKDLKTKKNPKGGIISTSRSNIKHPGVDDANSTLGSVSTTK